MYKVFDGSAIMAIGQQILYHLRICKNMCPSTFDSKGMLVQEYIAEALDPQPPDEWEDEDESGEDEDESDMDVDMEYIQQEQVHVL